MLAQTAGSVRSALDTVQAQTLREKVKDILARARELRDTRGEVRGSLFGPRAELANNAKFVEACPPESFEELLRALNALIAQAGEDASYTISHL